jgi:hypothetical protein
MFDQVHDIMTVLSCGYFHYVITHKNNIFGKNIRISTEFRENEYRSDRAKFEEHILPVILEMLAR